MGFELLQVFRGCLFQGYGLCIAAQRVKEESLPREPNTRRVSHSIEGSLIRFTGYKGQRHQTEHTSLIWQRIHTQKRL